MTQVDTNIASDELRIIRCFNAPSEQVWSALTDPEKLQNWWCPKGFTMEIKKVDMRPEGFMHYVMRGPGGMEMWGLWMIKEINEGRSMSVVVSFSNENAEILRAPFAQNWPLEILMSFAFDEHDGITTLTLTNVPYNSTEEERKSFRESQGMLSQGFEGPLDNLEQLLSKH